MSTTEAFSLSVKNSAFTISNDFKQFLAVDLTDASAPVLYQVDLESGLTISLDSSALDQAQVVITPGDSSTFSPGIPQVLPIEKSFTTVNIQMGDDPMTGEPRAYVNMTGIGIFDILLIDPLQIQYVQSKLAGEAATSDRTLGEIQSLFLQFLIDPEKGPSLILRPNLLLP